MRRFLLLCGAAAPVLMGGSALAADLPSAKAAPVEYVRVCSTHGAGFWYIPGSDTCIKVGGRVRAEFGYYQPLSAWTPSSPSFSGSKTPATVYGTNFRYGRDVDATGFRTDGRLNVDIRTATEWGTLRAYIRYEFKKFSGPYIAFNSTGGGASNTERLDMAFIQWAGLTAGRAASFWDFYKNDWNFQDLPGARSSSQTVNLFAYTASFGSGFSTTISVEDRADNQAGLRFAVPLALQQIVDGQVSYLPWFAPLDTGYGGTRMPDIVANLRVEQGWGSAQLSGVVHQVRYPSFQNTYSTLGSYLATNYGCPDVISNNACTGEAGADSTYGWGIQAGVTIKLPMLAKGDELTLQANYADGATSYLVPRYQEIGSSIGYSRDAWVFPQFNAKGQFTGATSQETVKGYSFLALLLHYWTPTVRQALFGAYQRLDNPSAFAPTWIKGPDIDGYQYGSPDLTVYQIGSNVVWSPVKGFDIGAEIGYIHNDAGSRPLYVSDNGLTGANQSKFWVTDSSQGIFYTRLRVQRDF
jgi:hypothetical protein